MSAYAEARRKAGLTRAQAAHALGLAASTLGRYERDESCPDRRMVGSMALLYGVPPERLGLRPDRPAPAGVDRHVWRGAAGRLHPSADLMAEWLVLTGAWDLFGADACAAMLDGRDGHSCRATAYMGRVRLITAAPWGARAYTVPGVVEDGVWKPIEKENA